ncbi:MAG: histidine phosphatase family protein [Xanthobacteraceae bacterium]
MPLSISRCFEGVEHAQTFERNLHRRRACDGFVGHACHRPLYRVIGRGERSGNRASAAGRRPCDCSSSRATFPDKADTDPLNFDNIATQRNLNDKGKMLAKQFGDALRQVGVPVGKVYTSKYNRGYETATLAGFKDIEKTADLTEGGLVVSPNENNRRADAFRALLATPPQAGTDTVLVTHYPNIIAALGKDWFDVKEGEASIFRPDNGSYKLLARIQMDEWPRIAAAAKTSAQH